MDLKTRKDERVCRTTAFISNNEIKWSSTELGKNLWVTNSDKKTITEMKIIFTVYFYII